ncbi:MAG: (2Fe-2S)-binding protein [Candidatus Odinarchaeota archaeon]|nr:(2Fe-2S)-binding protein [Candidatus Odinarchaeota archaeon]
MVVPKKIVCRCEDITEEEIIRAIKLGYTDMESLKRFVGFATGFCQGKTCMDLVMGILARETGQKIEEISATVARPPANPVYFKLLVGEKDEEED